MNSFEQGIIAMARSSLAACELMRRGTWTQEDTVHWLNAIITQDNGYLDSIVPEVLAMQPATFNLQP